MGRLAKEYLVQFAVSVGYAQKLCPERSQGCAVCLCLCLCLIYCRRRGGGGACACAVLGVRVLPLRHNYPGSSQASQKRSVEMVEGLFILWRDETTVMRVSQRKAIIQDDCDVEWRRSR